MLQVVPSFLNVAIVLYPFTECRNCSFLNGVRLIYLVATTAGLLLHGVVRTDTTLSNMFFFSLVFHTVLQNVVSLQRLDTLFWYWNKKRGVPLVRQFVGGRCSNQSVCKVNLEPRTRKKSVKNKYLTSTNFRVNIQAIKQKESKIFTQKTPQNYFVQVLKLFFTRSCWAWCPVGRQIS